MNESVQIVSSGQITPPFTIPVPDEDEQINVIIAVPGSGKTYQIASIISQAITSGTSPEEIFAVTFTKEAAAELVSRTDPGVRASTIHSLAYAIIYQKYDSLLDMDTKSRLFYDDLLKKAAEVVKSGHLPTISILAIDEAQDLNSLQFNFLMELVKLAKRVYIVGDPNQSIFSFCGADSRFMLGMQKKAKSIILNETRRFGQGIAKFVNEVFPHYPEISSQKPGGSVSIKPPIMPTPAHVHKAIKMVTDNSVAIAGNGTVGILFRTNYEVGSFLQGIEDPSKFNFVVPLSLHEYVPLVSTLLQMERDMSATDLISVAEFFGYSNRQTRSVLKSLAAIQYRRSLKLDIRTMRSIFTEVSSTSALPITTGVKRDMLNVLDILELMRPESDSIDEENILEIIADVAAMGYQHSSIIPASDEEIVSAVITRVVTGNDTYARYDNGSNITVQTVHSSKGREFNNVVYTVNPFMDIYNSEELRIAYVALTRARDHIDVILPIDGIRYDRSKDNIIDRLLMAGGII